VLFFSPLTFVVAAAVVAVFAGAAWPAQTCDASPLVIRNVDVWTPNGIAANRDVYMRGGMVASVEPARTRDGNVRMLDGTGQTLLPGLVDSHLHFSVPGGLPQLKGPRLDTSTITARQLLRSGVTSGRLHLASVDEAVDLKKRSMDPCGEMPRVQVGGPGLSGAAAKDFAAFQGTRSTSEAAAKVRAFAGAGVDWIAIHDVHRFQAEVLGEIARAARAHGVRLMAQGSNPEEIAAALSVAPDTLDYIDRTERAGYPAPLLDRIRAAKDLVLVPTVGVAFRATTYRGSPSRLGAADNFRFFSHEDAAHVLATAKKDLDSQQILEVVKYAPTLASKLQQLRALGVPMAIGSDAGSTLHFQSNAIWWEMEAWRAAGIPHREVLVAATANGARVLKLTDVGHLRPGARADFVLYRGRVEEGAFDVARVTAVGKGGVLFTPPNPTK
jgi:cytosine/adenosine deaminase-related metal-dependent hydrolase